jgi:hypothetical protein
MMNFETKYLIRWGIPGWVFIIFSYFTYLSYEKKNLLGYEFTVTQLLGIMISLGFVGIVLGYLMHQIYFSVNWIFSKQSSKIMQKTLDIIDKRDNIKDIDKYKFDHHKAYFMFEYHWQKLLVLQEEKQRDYISERYRYLLSTIHGLGALLVSILFSIAAVGLIIKLYGHNWFSTLMLFLLAYLGFSVWKGFGYYSENLIFYQGNFINAFQDEEFNKEINKDDKSE